MATNGYQKPGENNSLYADDLTEGQTLIAIDHGRWADSLTRITKYTVKKVTKTRLVLTLAGGARETRVIVRRGQWQDARGEVTRKIEGQGDWATGLTLATEDDPAVEEAREAARQGDLIRAAKRAVSDVNTSLNRESAAAAILALQAFLDGTE